MPRTETITVTSEPKLPTWLDRLAALKVELFVLTGFVLWIVACWPHRLLALGFPAVVIVWYGLPSRPPFVVGSRKDDAA